MIGSIKIIQQKMDKKETQNSWPCWFKGERCEPLECKFYPKSPNICEYPNCIKSAVGQKENNTLPQNEPTKNAL